MVAGMLWGFIILSPIMIEETPVGLFAYLFSLIFIPIVKFIMDITVILFAYELTKLTGAVQLTNSDIFFIVTLIFIIIKWVYRIINKFTKK